jgi:Holliday junction DNA helicase RuvA
MYDFIKGTVVETTASSVVVEVHGIGYRIVTPSCYLGKLEGEKLLYTSFVVREFSQTLYGFLTPQERELFEMFLTISGIGPKIALALVGHLEQDTLLQVVQNNDVAHLSRVPGIGKKTAEKLLVELKSKLKSLLLLMSPAKKMTSSATQDALAALMNLGYNQVRAERAVQKAREALSEDADLSEIIALALKH